MKKSIAIAGVSVLGLAGAVGGATAAQAAPTDACTSIDQHDTSDDHAANWYGSCIPQYGLGKAEFSITSTTPLPDDFDLSDPSVTATASVDQAAAQAYMNTDSTNGFTELELESASTDKLTQTYDGLIEYKLDAPEKIDPATLPAVCKSTGNDAVSYVAAYKVSYQPVTITFSKTIDGVEKKFIVTSTPDPLYLGLPFDGAFDDQNTEDEDGAWCATQGTSYSIQTDTTASGEAELIYYAHATRVPIPAPNELSSLSPFPNAVYTDDEINLGASSIGQLGTFAEYVPPVAPIEPAAVTPDPTLAATGQDSTVPVIAAGSLLAGGLAFVLVGRRRRKARG